ncbi:trypsin-like serine protease [Chelatococcus sambhunathii]|uniref:Trypsin-like serine protease n=1 Tax=Chelatococcus sambhunathii TaxID=363953 RepID=A0ABU1DFG1_9HYPH|nr:trypsin-like serine protease [Chelatococcus sambhunathii]MDR4306841.1 trypsin-like serine protease [Chelatococcus sambhunathii]
MGFGTRIAVYAAALTLTAGLAHAQVNKNGDTVAVATNGKAKIDYENAKPFKLPRSNAAPVSQAALLADGASVKFPGAPGFEKGAEGDGKETPKKLPVSKALAEEEDGVAPQEYGTNKHPYTTSLSQFYSQGYYRPAGKLFFKDGSSSFVCSASLIKRGLVVTAAHCVSSFGARRFYTGFQFVPAYNKGTAPFGVWTSVQARVMTSYFNGTDSCAVSGVVCANDVAVIVLAAQSGAYAGARAGYYGYGYNGYSYVNGQAAITQLGYPVALNGGLEQIRTDSQGSVSASNSNNTIIGSLQTGGSSGGPWLVNFGLTPTLTAPTGFGSAGRHNIVVGATSWGYTDTSASGPKEQGASPFTSANIVSLVNAACADFPAACQ